MRYSLVLCQDVELEYLVKKKNLYFAFTDLKKAFAGVPRDAAWWGLRNKAEESSRLMYMIWLMIMQSIYRQDFP